MQSTKTKKALHWETISLQMTQSITMNLKISMDVPTKQQMAKAVQKVDLDQVIASFLKLQLCENHKGLYDMSSGKISNVAKPNCR